jgi:pilus assembly protein FimV
MSFRILAVLFGIYGMFLSAPASALALSELEVLSKLNQPLHARVRLISISQAELDSLTINVDGDAGIGPLPAALQPAVEQDENGHFLVLRSREPIREPVMTVMLELNWSTGRLSREYALIIDPS